VWSGFELTAQCRNNLSEKVKNLFNTQKIIFRLPVHACMSSSQLLIVIIIEVSTELGYRPGLDCFDSRPRVPTLLGSRSRRVAVIWVALIGTSSCDYHCNELPGPFRVLIHWSVHPRTRDLDQVKLSIEVSRRNKRKCQSDPVQVLGEIGTESQGWAVNFWLRALDN
jgi:hypothetical protein